MAEKKRIQSLDFARGFALFFMVVIHILDVLANTHAQNSLFAYCIYCIGRLIDAPVFVFLMGISLSFSRRTTLGRGLKRALMLIFLGYLLNFLRGTLPVYLGLNYGNITYETMQHYTPQFLFKETDVLHFAGVSLVYLFLIKNYVKKIIVWLAIGLGMCVLFPFVQGIQTGILPIDYILDLHWGVEEYVHFSILPWIIYAVLGLSYGSLLAKTKDKKRFFTKSALIGGIITLCGFPFIYLYPASNLHSTFFLFRISPIGIVAYSGMICLWMAICYWIVQAIPNNPIFSRLYYWSKNVTSFYLVQWILIGWASILLYKVSLLTIVGLMIGITFLTDRIVVVWDLYSSWREKK